MKRIIKRIIVGAITCGFLVAGFSPITAKAEGTYAGENWTQVNAALVSDPIDVTPEDESLSYEAFGMDIYLEKGKATSGLLCFRLDSLNASNVSEYHTDVRIINLYKDGTEVTTSDGDTLLKYPLYIPLNADKDKYGENPFKDNKYLDEVRIVLINESDYNGKILYDNVRYVDAENLDDIDTEFNFLEHIGCLINLIKEEKASHDQILSVALALIDPMMTDEMLDRLLDANSIDAEVLVSQLDIGDINYKQLAALLTKLENINYGNAFINLHNKINDKGIDYITDFVDNLDAGDVSLYNIEILLNDYLTIVKDNLLNEDVSVLKDFGAFIEKIKTLGLTDNQLENAIDPVTKTLLEKVAALSESNKEIEEEIAEVQEQLEEKQQAIEDKDKEINEKSSEIDKLKKENEKNAADVAELEKKLKELEDEKAKTDAKIVEQEALVKKLQDEAAGKTDPGTNPSTDDKPSVTLKVGDTFVVGNGIYKITSADEVTLVSPKSDTLKTFTIEDTVKLMDGKDYKVTGIEANAFKENVKLSKVTIGANVAKIGKNAFNKCKKLKTITVNTELLTLKTVGANAFKGIKKKATFKVPASMKKDYKKLFTKKGAKKPKIK